jgi:hypothetical protein
MMVYMSQNRDSRPRRKSIERSVLRQNRIGIHRKLLAGIAANRGLKVFERDALIWATDGDSEWVFYRPSKPSERWLIAWQIAYMNPAALDQKSEENC